MGTLERNGLIKDIVQCLKSFGNSLVLPYRLFKIARVNLSIYNFSTLLAESGRWKGKISGKLRYGETKTLQSQ